MGFIVLLFLIVLAIFLSQILGADTTRKVSNAKANGIGFSVIATFIVCVVLIVSYESTISMKQRLANINAYKTTITAYVKTSKAFELKPGSEFTDLKYQNYQKQIADLLRDLRLEVVRYNNSLIGKTEFKQSFFWSWIIFGPPPGSKILIMSDYLE